MSSAQPFFTIAIPIAGLIFASGCSRQTDQRHNASLPPLEQIVDYVGESSGVSGAFLASPSSLRSFAIRHKLDPQALAASNTAAPGLTLGRLSFTQLTTVFSNGLALSDLRQRRPEINKHPRPDLVRVIMSKLPMKSSPGVLELVNESNGTFYYLARKPGEPYFDDMTRNWRGSWTLWKRQLICRPAGFARLLPGARHYLSEWRPRETHYQKLVLRLFAVRPESDKPTHDDLAEVGHVVSDPFHAVGYSGDRFRFPETSDPQASEFLATIALPEAQLFRPKPFVVHRESERLAMEAAKARPVRLETYEFSPAPTEQK